MYSIEIRLASKNGWHTPAEARSYYGRYDRHGITWHWWGDGGAGSHDGTVNYILNKAIQGSGSVNYVLSNGKITMLVNPDNVAWASQGGNPTTISVELQTFLDGEGYKKAGWLASELAGRYGSDRKYYPHNYWFSTQCPGTISLDRIRQEEDKWQRGEYNPQPTPPPTPTPPATPTLEWVKWKEGTITYVANKQPTTLWNFNATTHAGMKAVKTFNKGEQINIVGEVNNKTVGSKYLLTEYSFNNKITNGFNAADLDVYVPPRPTPEPPVPTPTPVPPYEPEWKAKLRDIDDTKFWFTKEQELIDITTGNPTGTKVFKKDEEFVCSALTISNGVEYRITDYSFKKGIFNGVPISSLTLTPPGVPDIPPVPSEPTDVNGKLDWIIKAIKAILSKLGINL